MNNKFSNLNIDFTNTNVIFDKKTNISLGMSTFANALEDHIVVRIPTKKEYNIPQLANIYNKDKQYLFTVVALNKKSTKKARDIEFHYSNYPNIFNLMQEQLNMLSKIGCSLYFNQDLSEYYDTIDFSHPMFYKSKSKLLFCITDRIFTIKQLHILVNHFDIDYYNDFIKDSHRLVDCQKDNYIKIIDYSSFIKLHDKKKKNCIVVTFNSIPINSDVFKNTSNCYIVNDLEDIDEKLVNTMYNNIK